MKRRWFLCLAVLWACRDEDRTVVTPPPPTHVEIGLMDGAHRIVYDLPDESWIADERARDVDPRAFTYRSGARTLDIFFSQEEAFDVHVQVLEGLAEAMRASGARVGTIVVDRNGRRAGFRATGLVMGGDAPRTARVELLRTGAFPSVYATVVLRTPPDDPFDLEPFIRTIKVVRR